MSQDDANEHTDQHVLLNIASDMLMLQEAQLETMMRVYDAIGVLLCSVEGNRVKWDGLREQHAEGNYYFPPFAIAESEVKDTSESEEYTKDDNEAV